MCGLQKHADAIVGTLGVEHRKRTTIGVELAAKVCKATFRPMLSRVDAFKAQIASLFGRTYVWP